MSARVLVQIVTYNSERHLKMCLEGLNAQSFRDFEISLFDNGSSDSTTEIIEKYRSVIQSIYLSDKNLGFCAAHNRLIGSAASEYILVLNPDVILDPHFIAIMVEELDRHP